VIKITERTNLLQTSNLKHLYCNLALKKLSRSLGKWLRTWYAYLNSSFYLHLLWYAQKDTCFCLSILQWFYSVTCILIPECLPCSKSQENKSSRASKSSANASAVPSENSSVPTEDDLDDFDPRGTSTSKYSEQVFNIVVVDSIQMRNIKLFFLLFCVWCTCNIHTEAFATQFIVRKWYNPRAARKKWRKIKLNN